MQIKVTRVLSNGTPLDLVSRSCGLLTSAAKPVKDLAAAAAAAAAELGGSASADAAPDPSGRHAVRFEFADASWCILVQVLSSEVVARNAKEKATLSLSNRQTATVVAAAKQAAALVKRIKGLIEARAAHTKKHGASEVLAANEKTLKGLLAGLGRTQAAAAALAGEGLTFTAWYVSSDAVPSVYKRVVPAAGLTKEDWAPVHFRITATGEEAVEKMPAKCRPIAAEQVADYLSDFAPVQ